MFQKALYPKYKLPMKNVFDCSFLTAINRNFVEDKLKGKCVTHGFGASKTPWSFQFLLLKYCKCVTKQITLLTRYTV